MEKTIAEQCDYFREELISSFGYKAEDLENMPFARLRQLARHERNAALVELVSKEPK